MSNCLQIILIIKKELIICSFKCFKKTALDFSLSNVSVIYNNKDFRIAVGARPQIACRCMSLEALLSKEKEISKEQIRESLKEDVSFGTNLSATKEYRESLAVNMINVCIKEVRDASKLSY